MNYPIWDLPSSGLLIAGIAILHVFISHFAVGGGLFLVLAERRARRTGDAEFLGYVIRHSRFFVLLTLVLGAVTGVGIWFTIGLVHPAGTSSLIQTWMWVWAIEWTFFATEIAAALVYYYGWHRLDPATHLAVGWVYFWSAWLSLFAINGILTFMLTPGAWVTTRSLLDGFFNPTFWPSLVARTAGAAGLAGVYALVTAAWERDPTLRARVSRFAALGWILPMAVVLPAALVWYLAAAAGAGVPVAALLGARSGTATGILRALLSGADSGQPITRFAGMLMIWASLTCLALVLAAQWQRLRRAPRAIALAIAACALVTLGGAEWVREGLRKPYVIGQFMFVNGVRLPAPAPVHALAGAHAARVAQDPFDLAHLSRAGVLTAARWTRPASDALQGLDRTLHDGSEVYRLLCASCHSVDHYNAVRPLVRGRPVEALDGMLARLATPAAATGGPGEWTDPAVRLVTWRDRAMPPFAGTDGERRALAVYLASLGGATRESLEAKPAVADPGVAFFEANCAMCHGVDGQWPMAGRPRRDAAAFYELLGALPRINELMPEFTGSEAERRAVAAHLAVLTGHGSTPAPTTPALEIPR